MAPRDPELVRMATWVPVGDPLWSVIDGSSVVASGA